MRRVAAAVGGVLMAAGASGVAQEGGANAFTPDQIGRGAALYVTHCEACHGVRMIGPPWGADLNNFPRDNPRRFVDSVTHGRNAMPPWGDVLKPDEIAALWAYVVAGESKK